MAYITSLRLTDFRSYAALDLTLDHGPIVLFGPNGAGKTNLLEAVSLLSPGRGLRRAPPDRLAHTVDGNVQPAWGINAMTDRDQRISVGQVPENPRRRVLRLDGKNATGGDLAKLISVMWLTPAQDRLFSGPASDRRKFLDRFCLAHQPGHGIASLRFEKARAERNRLLSDDVDDRGWYDALEADLAAQGAVIAQNRVETVIALQAAVDSRDTIFPKSEITLSGTVEQMCLEDESLDDVEVSYRELLASTRGQDRRAGRTLIGPHRSDLVVSHIDKAMPAEQCSTGEQKALLIGLVLAQARSLGDRQPILLLDEIAAHLDNIRRAALAEELHDLGLQVFMTGTDAALFSDFGPNTQIFRVDDGSLTPI
ncbi:DNA replication/repair protein RecF [Litorimonas sp. RW-G-Af-16]|uniref:DNA replication/repair protein RecF n=1 Tax=Litorimonas sp. RW-G-Af-16 TaxID=3241168 RepID=UPI00390CBFBB